MMKKILSLLMALVVMFSLAMPAFATTTDLPSDSTILIKGKGVFGFQVDSEYHATDLFDEFKDIMPGDRLTETITIANQYKSYDYVKVYLRAVPHDEDTVENGNHLDYSENFEEEDGKDQSGDPDKRDETVASMEDFLSKLTLKVWDKKDNLIFEGSPDQLDGLEKKVNLGTIRKNKQMQLKAELYWDPDGDYNYNDYANRVGEVDWIFTVEFRNDPSDSPKTGDYIIMGAAAAMAISAAALVILFIAKKRKKTQ